MHEQFRYLLFSRCKLIVPFGRNTKENWLSWAFLVLIAFKQWHSWLTSTGSDCNCYLTCDKRANWQKQHNECELINVHLVILIWRVIRNRSFYIYSDISYGHWMLWCTYTWKLGRNLHNRVIWARTMRFTILNHVFQYKLSVSIRYIPRMTRNSRN